MLVIPCGVRDELQIGDSISIVVLEVGEDHVRLGVTSPNQVPEYQEHFLYVSDADTMRGDPAEADQPLVGA